MTRGEKLGQMKLSFGMIFSIILIIAFLALAIYGIITFLDIQKNAMVGKFYENFQADIDALYKGTFGTNPDAVYQLPSNIKYICLQRSQYDENLYFLPKNNGLKIDYVNIKNIDIDKTTEAANKQINPLNPSIPEEVSGHICFKNQGGEVKMILKKERGENLVTVSRGI